MPRPIAFKPDRVYVIAEAGVNHSGSLEAALQLADAAAEAGADAVKFQTFRAAELATDAAPMADYQKRNTGTNGSQFGMLKRLELSRVAHRRLIARCRRHGIDFLSSPFDAKSMRLLTQTFHLPVVKIPSGEITNAPLLLQAARSAKQIILSTGMSTLADIESALSVIAFGFSGGRKKTPSPGDFLAAYRSSSAQRLLRDRVIVLQCVTDYPARFEDINLRAMDTIRAAFGLRVGLSDHSPGIAVPIAAAARGACIIEKHFTLDRRLPGPDHRASLEPPELKAMIEGIRQVERALGDGRKRPTAAEKRNRTVCRKGLVAAREIKKGELYSAANVTAKRGSGGRVPLEYWAVLGQRAVRRLAKDDPIE